MIFFWIQLERLQDSSVGLKAHANSGKIHLKGAEVRDISGRSGFTRFIWSCRFRLQVARISGFRGVSANPGAQNMLAKALASAPFQRAHTTKSVRHTSNKARPCVVCFCLDRVERPHSESEEHRRAQYFAPEPVRNAHSGSALAPRGMSLGQTSRLSHLGLQKSPDMPLTRTASSSSWHPLCGFP